MAKSSPIELRGATAIVTGGSAGIGLHIARRLAAHGVQLAIVARNEAHLNIAADELRAIGVRVLPVPADVSSLPQLEVVVRRTLAEFGRIDLLVNNAGVEAFCAYEELPLTDIERTVAVNVIAAMNLTRLVVPHMLAAGRGHVVNMSSTAGKLNPAFGAVYAATKSALIAFSFSLRAELRDRGVSCSVVCPGFTTEGGIYDRIQTRSGRRTPRFVGETTAECVADAVLKAIRRDRAELIVNWPPMRPMAALMQLCPSWGLAVSRAVSYRFLKRVAQSRSNEPRT